VVDDVKQWQSRPLDAVYPVVYLDCIHVKVRDTGEVSGGGVDKGDIAAESGGCGA